MVQFSSELRAGRLQRSALFSTAHLKAPSSKLQVPSSKSVCCLELDISLELGALSLGLSTNYLPRCSGNSPRMLSSFAWQIPRSVMSPVTNWRGVTSKPKFAAALLCGVTRTSICSPPCQPSAQFTTSEPRSSIGIAFRPSRIFQSNEEEGSAT